MTKIIDSGKFKLICFLIFFGNWANVIWVTNMKLCNFLFSMRKKILFCIHPLLLSFSTLPVIHSSSFFLMLADCMYPLPRDRMGPSILCSRFFFFHVLYLSLCVPLETKRSQFQNGRLASSIFSFLVDVCLVSFILIAQPSSSQYLPVLSKC